MTPSPDQILQYLGWMFALFELIFAAYILYLNPGKSANRLASAFMAVLGLTTFALSSLASASAPQTALSYALALAVFIPMLNPIQLLLLLAVFPPGEALHRRRWKWIQPLLYGLILLPLILTLMDQRFGSRFWFSGLPQTFAGGYLPIFEYTKGVINPLVFILNFMICGLGVFAYLLIRVILKPGIEREKRHTAVWFFAANLLATLFFVLQRSGNFPIVVAIAATILYLIAFGSAVFQDVISKRREQTGSLQLRLTALALIVAIPLIVGVTVFLSEQARRSLTQSASNSLTNANYSITEAMTLWLDYNTRALKMMVTNPGVVAMNPLWQDPIVREMAAAYPYMYLVSTTDGNGLNTVRSDGLPLENFSDRYWFQNARSGAPVTFETLIGKAYNRPALSVSMPIVNDYGDIVGVGMFATELEQITNLVQAVGLGKGASVFVVDQRDILVAHSDPRARVLANLNGHPAVEALRNGTMGMFQYTDNEGQRIQSYISELPNGWGVIVQQTEAGLFEPIRRFQGLAFIVMVLGASLMTLLIYTAIRQAIRPVRDMTETAVAVSQGDLNRKVEVMSQDELGILGQTFNQMTDQLQTLVGGLESRVAERTQALERRALQFQVTAEVAKEAAAIHRPEKLLQDVVDLISDRFGFDHAGIFLLELAETSTPSLASEAQQGYAVLQAASSEGGQKMLKRRHRLRIGQQGLVGYVAATGQPRIALDVGSDAVFFNNPDLPLTRSEIALPLKVQNRVIGVLDVQSNKAGAFSDEDLSILQILADQVALAIENARLLADSQQALRELESLYGMQIRKGWTKRLANKPLAYFFDRHGAVRISTESPEDSAINEHEPSETTMPEVVAPIELRGQTIGALRLHRIAESAGWSEDEKELIREIVAQLALSLENARLMEEIRAHASQEEMINQIVARTQSSLNMETVMKTAVAEIGRIMRLSRVRIRLEEPPQEQGSNGHHAEAERPENTNDNGDDHGDAYGEDRPQEAG